ncbi:hypothetical protein ALI144C_48360 [Actinosynnema sp. ALI-1.44]|uniref:DUF4383 domain-containing protein n=1 Tax=Actinosynnema sp. ALI-1.44 TaxID=1933779 RepID=UPI00097BC9C1|nr:DUF4383 domain-containing protein [Actinosynnema sp. ALI-1.44]ONI70467.1 hypothetical protein ALI144C_48360 [Actinosynnema sp. ALI-1.44]
MAESVRARLQPTQVLAGLVGLAFLALGVIGFVHTGFNDFAGQGHTMLWGVFAINPLHNVIHLLFGFVGLLMALTSATSRLFGWVVFAGYGALLVWGLMLVGLTSTNPVSELGNPLNLNVADNWLHLGIALLGLVIAIVPLRRKVIETEPEPVQVAPMQEPVTDPVPAQQPQTVAATDETVARQEEPKPRGLHRLSRLRSKGTTAH